MSVDFFLRSARLGFRWWAERYAATGMDHPSYRLTTEEYEVVGESFLGRPPRIGL